MEMFDHPVGLQVETGGSRMRNFQRFTDSGPDGGCELSSMVHRGGTLKREIQVEIKAFAQDTADMEVNIVASCQPVVQSITVNMYAWLEAEGRCPPGQCEHEQNLFQGDPNAWNWMWV